MVQLDVRVTSVQIVARFPAHVIIPGPPGWEPGCRTSAGASPEVPTHATLTSPVALSTGENNLRAECTAVNEKRTIKIEDNISHILSIGDTLSADSIFEESIDAPQPHQSARLAYCMDPVTSQSEYGPSVSADVGMRKFKSRKLTNEQKHINFMVNRGTWIDQPPPFLNFKSCKDGPIFYVNEVVGKNVSQIWQRTTGRWVSVKEGHTVFTERERKVALDKHQVPHLLAVEHRRRRNREDTGSQL